MPGVQDLFGMTTKRHFHPGAQTKEILNTPHHRRTTSNVRAPLRRRRVADVATTEEEHERARSLRFSNNTAHSDYLSFEPTRSHTAVLALEPNVFRASGMNPEARETRALLFVGGALFFFLGGGYAGISPPTNNIARVTRDFGIKPDVQTG